VVSIDQIAERLRTSQKNIKVLRYSLKSLVEPEDCKYINVTPNAGTYQSIEILPDKVPIHCRVRADDQKNPATLSIQLNRQ